MGDPLPASTFLFVAAHEQKKVDKALASNVHAVILDLEDAVPPEMKTVAREAAAAVLESSRPPASPQVWVRVNGAETPHFAGDVDRVAWGRSDGVVLPKAEHPSSVSALAEAGARRQILLIETVAGLRTLDTLAQAARTDVRLAIGTWDLARDLELPGLADPDDSEMIWHIRCEIVLESRRLQLGPAIDGVCGRLGDLSRLEAMCRRAHQLGFGGKLLIHPEQVPVASRIFDVDERTVREARAIIAAYEEAEREGRGAVRYAGMLIDRVHVDRARRLVDMQQGRKRLRRARG